MIVIFLVILFLWALYNVALMYGKRTMLITLTLVQLLMVVVYFKSSDEYTLVYTLVLNIALIFVFFFFKFDKRYALYEAVRKSPFVPLAIAGLYSCDKKIINFIIENIKNTFKQIDSKDIRGFLTLHATEEKCEVTLFIKTEEQYINICDSGLNYSETELLNNGGSIKIVYDYPEELKAKSIEKSEIAKKIKRDWRLWAVLLISFLGIKKIWHNGSLGEIILLSFQFVIIVYDIRLWPYEKKVVSLLMAIVGIILYCIDIFT